MRGGRWLGLVCGLVIALALSACSKRAVKTGAGGGAGGTGPGGSATGVAGAAGTTGAGGAGTTGVAGTTGAGVAGTTGAGGAGAAGAGGTSGAGGTCVTGYRLSATGTCLWGPMPLDPGFQNTPAGAWTLERGAAIMPTATGIVEPGALALDKTAICAGARARQTITMPGRAASEAFALRVAASGTCKSSASSTSNDCTAPDVVTILNGAATYFRLMNFPFSSGNRTACLGERAYGGVVDVVAQAAYRTGCSNAILDLAIDHVGIEPLATCPMPGTLPDGDFEATASNWTGQISTGTPSPNSTAEIQAGVGTNNSRAAHLRTNDDCQAATLTGPISSPLASIPNLAVQLTYRGTVNENLVVKLDDVTIGSITSTSAQTATVARACVPENSKGMTQTALLGLFGPPTFIQNCTPPHMNEFVVDDLQFVSDPTCAAAAWVSDGGFERTDPARAWSFGLTTDTVQGGVASATVDTTPANARSGQRAVKLSTNGGCSSASVFVPISIPMPTATAGPALTLFYRTAPALTSSRPTLTAGTSSATLSDARDYTQVQVCLDPTLGGQNVAANVQMNGGFIDCSVTFPDESIWIDDVAVTTSPTCPAI